MVRNKPRAGGSIREPSSVPGSVPDLLVIRAPKFPDVVHSNPHAQAGRSSGFRFLSRWIGPRHHCITGGHGLTVKKNGRNCPGALRHQRTEFPAPALLVGRPFTGRLDKDCDGITALSYHAAPRQEA